MSEPDSMHVSQLFLSADLNLFLCCFPPLNPYPLLPPASGPSSPTLFLQLHLLTECCWYAGCSKTTLARAAATASKASMFPLSGAQLYSMYVGEGEALLRGTFKMARQAAPSIIFLDEVDSLAGNSPAIAMGLRVRVRPVDLGLNNSIIGLEWGLWLAV